MEPEKIKTNESLPNGWIRMTEEIPEEDGQYLVTALNPFFGGFSTTQDVAFLENGIWHSWLSSKQILVVAWKRLDKDLENEMFPELAEMLTPKDFSTGQQIWVNKYDKIQFGTNVQLTSIAKYH